MTEELYFSRGPARRPMPRIVDPLLQWSTGLTTTDRQIYVGWLAETRKSESFDEACHQSGYKTVKIKHGGGNVVEHWAIESAAFFVVAEGVQSIGEMKHTSQRHGIAFGWRTLPGGRAQSQLRLRAFLHEQLVMGFAEPVTVTVKGTLTGDMITALMRQYDVIDAVDAFRKESGKLPSGSPFYAYSIPLTAGQEVTRGSGGATKQLTPMITTIPDPITREYAVNHWIKRGWIPLIENLLDETIAWSVATSQLIASDSDERPVTEDTDAEAGSLH